MPTDHVTPLQKGQVLIASGRHGPPEAMAKGQGSQRAYLGAGEGLGPPGLEESGGSTLPSVGRNHDRYLSTRMK